MDANIPDKLYFKIGEVGKLAQVQPHVLRYWETEFKHIRPKRANSKQRLYRREDVELILKIKHLLHEQGYTIAGAKKLLEPGDEASLAAAAAPPEKVVRKAKSEVGLALASIKGELKKLQQLIDKKE